MSWLHLLWIVPVCASAGTVLSALCFAAGHEDRQMEKLREKESRRDHGPERH